MSSSFDFSPFGSSNSGGFFGSSGGGFSYDDDDDEDPSSIRARFEKNKDSVVFLIDCGEQMMKPGSDGKSAFQIVIELAKNVLQNKLIQGGKDEMGICFYNTQNAKNPNGFNGIYHAMELDEPEAKGVRELEKFIEKEHFDAVVGSGAEECEFHRALWTCSSVFTSRKNSKKAHQRIMLFTGNDRPNAARGAVRYRELKTKAIQKAKDLEDLGISLILNPINVDGTIFRVQSFFADILLVDDEDGLEKFDEQVAQTYEDLKSRCYKRIFHKRALASCPLTIGSNMKIGLKVYSTMRTATKRSPVQLDSRNNQRLTCVTKWFCNSTAANLEDFQIKSYYPYGSEKVYFAKDEMHEIKDFGPPGIKLMGFKSRDTLRWEQNTKPCLFIRPDEGQFKGSTTAFWALLEEMIRLRKIAIARVIYRKASVPRFAALYPVKEREDDTWEDKTGMYMIFLPYADDSRDLSIPAQPIADDSKLPGLISSMRTLVRSLKDEVDPSSYNNPLLQKHYSNLEAMALEKEDPAEVEDELVPDAEGFGSVEGDCKAIDNLLDSKVEEPEPKSKKRKGGTKSRGATKKAKAAVMEISEADFRNAAGSLNKLKVADLKNFCRAKDLSLGGRKADLVERVQKWLAENP